MKRSPITTIDLGPSAIVSVADVFRPGVFGAEPGDLAIENSTGIVRICTRAQQGEPNRPAAWERISPDRLSLESLDLIEKKVGTSAAYLTRRHTTRPENA